MSDSAERKIAELEASLTEAVKVAESHLIVVVALLKKHGNTELTREDLDDSDIVGYDVVSHPDKESFEIKGVTLD